MTECLPKKPNIAEISPHLICALCGGYLIDATTIVECLHSFCKTCIVRYLESSKYCPICEVLVHKTRPLQNIKLDHTLQDIVYKLVPGLFQNEMRRRREFYKDSPTIRSEKARQEQQRDRYIFSADEHFSVALEFCPQGRVRRTSGRKSQKKSFNTAPERRYLLCPAGTTIAMLRKFIQLKFSLGPDMQVDIVHAGGTLRDHYSLMDVAYIYSWKREGVLQLYYTVYKMPPSVSDTIVTEIKDEQQIHVPCSADDKLLKPDDNRPSSLFSKATLLGNHAMDRNLHHDLSPLELIATVANDISCLQEGRGLKRKTEVAQLYENDEDASSTETQIKRTVERAIDLCSSNSSKSLKDKKISEVASAAVLQNKTQNSKSSSTKAPSKVDEKSGRNDAHSTSKSVPQIKDNNSNTLSATSSKSGLSVELRDKPRKTDTASQCDHKAKKITTELHSKTSSKSENSRKSENLTSCSKNSSKPYEQPQNRKKPGDCAKISAKQNVTSKPEKTPNDCSKNVKNVSKNKEDTSKLAVKPECAIKSKDASELSADKEPSVLHNKTSSGRKLDKTHTGSPSKPTGNSATSSPARIHPSTATGVSKGQSAEPTHPDQKPNPSKPQVSNKADKAPCDSETKPVQKKVGGPRPLFKKSNDTPAKTDKVAVDGKTGAQKFSANGNIAERAASVSKLAFPVAKNGDACHKNPESVGDASESIKENNNKTDDKGKVDKEQTCAVSEKISHSQDKVTEATKVAPQINGHSTPNEIATKQHTGQPTSK